MFKRGAMQARCHLNLTHDISRHTALLNGRVLGERPVISGLGSVRFSSRLRARADFFIFCFSGIGKHHTIQKKEKYGFPEIGCARGPQVQIFFLGHVTFPLWIVPSV